MKKTLQLLVAVALLLSVSMSANAQFSKRQNSRVPDRFHMGLRAGLTSNTFIGDGDEYLDPLLFATAGFALDFQVAPVPIFVGIGLNYVNMGYKYDGYHETETEDWHCVHMPITASYHINVAPNLFINTFFGGFMAYNCTDIDEDEEWDDDRFNYGLRLGCGMNFGRLTFDIGYDMGLKNFGDKHYDIKSGTLFVTVGFNWAGDR